MFRISRFAAMFLVLAVPGIFPGGAAGSTQDGSRSEQQRFRVEHIRDLIRTPALYEGKSVMVSGKVLSIASRSFVLADDAENIPVYLPASLPSADKLVRPGQRVMLTAEVRRLQPGDVNRLGLDLAGPPQPLGRPVLVFQGVQVESGADTDSSAVGGMHVAPLSIDAARRLGIDRRKGGLILTEVDLGSTASELGLRRGDVLLSLNGRTLKSAKQLQEYVRELGHETGIFKVAEGGDPDKINYFVLRFR